METKPLTLSELLALDPQMTVPEYPRLSEDVVKVWDSEASLIVYGSASPVAFGGKAVGLILPKVMPLMDGRHSIADIAAKLSDIPPGHLQKAVSLMYMKGMIEDGVASTRLDSAQAAQFRPQLQFYARYLDLTRVFRNRHDLLAALRESRVLMLTDCAKAAEIVGDLADMGLGHVELLAPEALHAACRAASAPSLAVEGQAVDVAGFPAALSRIALTDYDLVCLVLQDDDPALARRINRDIGRAHVKFAYAVIGNRRIQIGPVVQKPNSGCVECMQLPESMPELDAAHDEYARDYAARHFAVSCLALLTKFLPITTMDHIQLLSADSLKFVSVPLYKQPACAVCGKADFVAANDAAIATGAGMRHPLPWFYNENTGFKSHQMVPKGHQAHYDEKNKRAVAGAFKKIENAKKDRIPEAPGIPQGMKRPYGGSVRLAEKDGSGVDSLRRINMLMTLSASRMMHSIAEGMNIGFRITPSAGAMSSQNLYLINLGLDGLGPGAYYFSPEGDLQNIRETAPDLADLGLDVAAGRSGQPLAAIVVTNAYARVESKYLGISYRYVLGDCGAMLATLMGSAPRLGLELRHTAQFYDDVLSAYLGCCGVTELPLVVCLVHDADQGAGRDVHPVSASSGALS